MAEKRQFMALVERKTLFRLDRLRIVAGESRARVAEMALVGGGMRLMERQYDQEIVRLDEIAQRFGITMQELVEWYAATYTRQYGPGLDGIEQAYREAHSVATVTA